ncbi:MAG TPA: hypothetical protein VFV98_18810, partial [Vicinamibacterales bacterium]|nr:hypothetical protein [Vicinamibacterales bacterium]
MRKTLVLAIALMAVPAVRAAQATRPFSAEDMLDVVSASMQDISEDGRLVALTERRTRDNATTDNYRYGDPTFLAPSAARLVVVDIETGKRLLPLGDRLLNIRQAAFSRDGKRLAMLVALPNATAISLHVWNTDGATPPAPVAIESSNAIALNSALDWTADNARVVVAMRTPAREQEAADRFKALTQGPIIVHTS